MPSRGVLDSRQERKSTHFLLRTAAAFRSRRALGTAHIPSVAALPAIARGVSHPALYHCRVFLLARASTSREPSACCHPDPLRQKPTTRNQRKQPLAVIPLGSGKACHHANLPRHPKTRALRAHWWVCCCASDYPPPLRHPR